MCQIEDQIKSIVADRLDIDPSTIKIESKIIEDLGGDSLDTAIISMDIEKHFFLSIPDQEIEVIQTFGELVDLVKHKI